MNLRYFPKCLKIPLRTSTKCFVSCTINDSLEDLSDLLIKYSGSRDFHWHILLLSDFVHDLKLKKKPFPKSALFPSSDNEVSNFMDSFYSNRPVNENSSI
jgi:hypothetical protein